MAQTGKLKIDIELGDGAKKIIETFGALSKLGESFKPPQKEYPPEQDGDGDGAPAGGWAAYSGRLEAELHKERQRLSDAQVANRELTIQKADLEGRLVRLNDTCRDLRTDKMQRNSEVARLKSRIQILEAEKKHNVPDIGDVAGEDRNDPDDGNTYFLRRIEVINGHPNAYINDVFGGHNRYIPLTEWLEWELN